MDGSGFASYLNTIGVDMTEFVGIVYGAEL